jgi:hypothetical protein
MREKWEDGGKVSTWSREKGEGAVLLKHLNGPTNLRNRRALWIEARGLFTRLLEETNDLMPCLSA